MTKSEIKTKVIEYLNADTTEESKISLLVDKAWGNVKLKRNYPDTYDTESIEEEIGSKYGWVVFDIVILAISKEGAEGEKQHTENGVSITYSEINDSNLYSSIIPIARVL